jgi:hypothetical protein
MLMHIKQNLSYQVLLSYLWFINTYHELQKQIYFLCGFSVIFHIWLKWSQETLDIFKNMNDADSVHLSSSHGHC